MAMKKGPDPTKTKTPAELGYRMPAEWAPREGTIMGWPVRAEIWPDGLDAARRAYAEVARVIASGERLIMVTREDCVAQAREMCGSSVEVFPCAQDDSWLRDNGPTFVLDAAGNRAAIDWDFNAWGAKYKPYEADRKVAAHVLESLSVPRFGVPIVLEGGSIHSDGEGTIITTEECLLNKNRNPSLTKEEIEQYLYDHIGALKVIWLPRGLYLDETDGHVDNVCCFTAPGEVLVQVRDDRSDPDWGIVQENLEILRNATDAKGRRFVVREIPAPPVLSYKGERLCASYINYYPANAGIVMPAFAGGAGVFGAALAKAVADADDAAAEVLSGIFPGKAIHRIDGLSIVKGGGNVHCITQQVPRAGV